MEKKILYHIGLLCESITEEDFLQDLESPTF